MLGVVHAMRFGWLSSRAAWAASSACVWSQVCVPLTPCRLCCFCSCLCVALCMGPSLLGRLTVVCCGGMTTALIPLPRPVGIADDIRSDEQSNTDRHSPLIGIQRCGAGCDVHGRPSPSRVLPPQRHGLNFFTPGWIEGSRPVHRSTPGT